MSTKQQKRIADAAAVGTPLCRRVVGLNSAIGAYLTMLLSLPRNDEYIESHILALSRQAAEFVTLVDALLDAPQEG